MTKCFTNRQGGRQKLNRLKQKNFGVIAIEVCFTLPVVIYLIFFTIELIKINITQDALQSICEEITYMTIAHDYEDGADLINKGNAIVEKYRPVFIPEKAICPAYTSEKEEAVIRWCFESYPMFGEANDMLSSAPYGGSTITYPKYKGDESGSLHASQSYHVGSSQFMPIGGMECPACPEHWSYTRDCMKGKGLSNNRVFVLTVTCNYRFSNPLVKKLFNNGVNTRFVRFLSKPPQKATGNPGTMYLLWARGAGIVNAK